METGKEWVRPVITEYKLNDLIANNLFSLVKKFAQEVRAERKYSEPLISSRKVEALATWKFMQYTLTN